MIIDPDTLERLLIDREMGELSPEAATLLDAVVGGDREAQAIESSVRKTLSAARAAMAPAQSVASARETALALPPLPRRRQYLWRGAAAAAAAAACVLIGLETGRLAPLAPPQHMPATAFILTPQTPTQHEGAGQFWSIKNLRPLEPPTTHGPSFRLKWTSPAGMPLIEENNL